MTKNAEDQIISQALTILEGRLRQYGPVLNSPTTVRNYATLALAGLDHEVFGVFFLNTRLALIEFNQMFRGTIHGASVYPREVAKRALEVNAKAVIFTHNHPSGEADPSEADRVLTKQLKKVLALFEINVLDHLVIGYKEQFSFAENGLL